MAKPGRNDRCPCGSGKKYKQCCLTRDEVAERARLAEAQARREELAEAEVRRAATHVPGIRELTTAIAARLGMSEHVTGFGCRPVTDREPTRAGPAYESRQGRKARAIGWPGAAGRYGDLVIPDRTAWGRRARRPRCA